MNVIDCTRNESRTTDADNATPLFGSTYAPAHHPLCYQHVFSDPGVYHYTLRHPEAPVGERNAIFTCTSACRSSGRGGGWIFLSISCVLFCARFSPLNSVSSILRPSSLFRLLLTSFFTLIPSFPSFSFFHGPGFSFFFRDCLLTLSLDSNF